jgi:hypothetical protein
MRRAVFSELQRRGLERRFQIQKYISKPERKKLAEKLALKDSQVRVCIIVAVSLSTVTHYFVNKEKNR